MLTGVLLALALLVLAMSGSRLNWKLLHSVKQGFKAQAKKTGCPDKYKKSYNVLKFFCRMGTPEFLLQNIAGFSADELSCIGYGCTEFEQKKDEDERQCCNTHKELEKLQDSTLLFTQTEVLKKNLAEALGIQVKSQPKGPVEISDVVQQDSGNQVVNSTADQEVVDVDMCWCQGEATHIGDALRKKADLGRKPDFSSRCAAADACSGCAYKETKQCCSNVKGVDGTNVPEQACKDNKGKAGKIEQSGSCRCGGYSRTMSVIMESMKGESAGCSQHACGKCRYRGVYCV